MTCSLFTSKVVEMNCGPINVFTNQGKSNSFVAEPVGALLEPTTSAALCLWKYSKRKCVKTSCVWNDIVCEVMVVCFLPQEALDNLM